MEVPVCLEKTFLAYLPLRGPSLGPLFTFQDGSPQSDLDLILAVRSALESQDINIHRFNGHSFRIGVATIAVASGIEDSLIQALEHWKSSAFTTYILTPKDSLISASSFSSPSLGTRHLWLSNFASIVSQIMYFVFFSFYIVVVVILFVSLPHLSCTIIRSCLGQQGALSPLGVSDLDTHSPFVVELLRESQPMSGQCVSLMSTEVASCGHAWE